MTHFLWAYELGFWLMLGFLQAILLLLCILFLAAKVFYVSTKALQTLGVNRWVFKRLPTHISSMRLNYNKKAKTLVATARVDSKNGFFYRSKIVEVPQTKVLKEYAEELQLDLMSDISKELKECKISL